MADVHADRKAWREAGMLHAVLLAGGMHPHRPPRQRTLIRAVLDCDGLPQQHALVRNVSEDGLCVTALGTAPTSGEQVRVTLPTGIALEGEVRWAEGAAFGIRLLQRLDMRQLAAATRRRNAQTASAVNWRVGASLAAPEAPDPRLRRI